jgi:hypothetical protein
LRILAAILKNFGQLLNGLLGQAGARLGDDLLVELDEVEFIRQLESLDAAGQFGDRLVLFERVQSVGAAFVFLRVVGLPAKHAAAAPRALSHRLHAELLLVELGQVIADRVQPIGRVLDRLRQSPTPALAVRFGGFPALGNRVIDRLSLGIDGSAVVFAIELITFVVVGQRGQVGQRLQPPGLMKTTVVEQRFAQVHQELRDFVFPIVLLH